MFMFITINNKQLVDWKIRITIFFIYLFILWRMDLNFLLLQVHLAVEVEAGAMHTAQLDDLNLNLFKSGVAGGDSNFFFFLFLSPSARSRSPHRMARRKWSRPPP